jgi:hypothetical protein
MHDLGDSARWVTHSIRSCIYLPILTAARPLYSKKLRVHPPNTRVPALAPQNRRFLEVNWSRCQLLCRSLEPIVVPAERFLYDVLSQLYSAGIQDRIIMQYQTCANSSQYANP